MGGYNCYCLRGYWLKKDNKTCAGKFGKLSYSFFSGSLYVNFLRVQWSWICNVHKKAKVFMPLAKDKYFLSFRSSRHVRQLQTDHTLSWHGSVRGDCVCQCVDRYRYCGMRNSLQKECTVKRQWHARGKWKLPLSVVKAIKEWFCLKHFSYEILSFGSYSQKIKINFGNFQDKFCWFSKRF